MQDNLIGTLLCAALEETGAQRGLLILSRSGEGIVNLRTKPETLVP